MLKQKSLPSTPRSKCSNKRDPRKQKEKPRRKTNKTRTRKKRRKPTTRKQTFVGKNQGPTRRKERLKARNTTGAPITKTKQQKNGVSGYAINRKSAKTNKESNQQISLPMVKLKQKQRLLSNLMPTWRLSIR